MQPLYNVENPLKRVLITGCNGQLGRAIRQLAYREKTIEYYMTDVDQLDITNYETITTFIAEHNITAIINCAAYTAVDAAESDEATCHLINATAPGYLAKAIEAVGGEMIQVSTDYVFDGSATQPYTEDMPTNPQSAYGRTKAIGEQAVLNACKRSAVVRTAWLYAALGNNFVRTMLRLATERAELRVVADQVGTPTYAPDLAEVLIAMLHHKGGIIPGIYHYTNEGMASWYDFAVAAIRMADLDPNCRVLPCTTADYPTPAQRPAYSILSKQKIYDTYGIRPKHWFISLCECIDYLRQCDELPRFALRRIDTPPLNVVNRAND